MKKTALLLTIGVCILIGLASRYVAIPTVLPWPGFSQAPKHAANEKPVNRNVKPAAPEVQAVLNGSHRLIGGMINGKWRDRHELAKALTGGETFRFYSRFREVGQAKRSNIRSEHYLGGETGYYLEFPDSFPEEAFEICCDWNPIPRALRVETQPEQYQVLVERVLAQKNRSAGEIVIKEALSVDLDNDGKTEIIIYATNIKQEEVTELADGKITDPYQRTSIVLLCREGMDQPLTLVESYEGMTEYAVPFVADVDGDGVMEIMIAEIFLDALPAEGFSLLGELLLKVKGEKMELMAEINSNPV